MCELCRECRFTSALCSECKDYGCVPYPPPPSFLSCASSQSLQFTNNSGGEGLWQRRWEGVRDIKGVVQVARRKDQDLHLEGGGQKCRNLFAFYLSLAGGQQVDHDRVANPQLREI